MAAPGSEMQGIGPKGTEGICHDCDSRYTSEMTPGIGGCKVGVPGTIGWDVALFLSTTSCLTCLFRNGAEQHVAACGEYRLVTLIASEIMQYIAQETKESPEG
jgi:hypothetical protein